MNSKKAKLVDELASIGWKLEPEWCYQFKIPTIIGGEFEIANIDTNTIDERIRFCGAVHRQIKDLPNGASIKFKLK